MKKGKGPSIEWKQWSEESFEHARKEGRLVLLDLTATWCHWCHVMDERTYADPEVARTINEKFVAIRVDIDRRPDISERYNRGGFPTTAFLSDQGESIWGATFVPPTDMKRIMEAIIKAHESGEIGKALERSRMKFLDINKRRGDIVPMGQAEIDGIFEDILSAYDVEFGGFGTEPKFPHPEVLELFLTKFLRTGDDELAEVVTNTLDRMIEGLEDKAEGGVFRYSVTRDWSTPHYEKMLETNAGFLRNLTNAFGVIDDRRYDESAKSIAGYILRALRDPSGGGFFGSQDADEEYYSLPLPQRSGRTAPSVDTTVYAGWNAQVASALMQAGIVLQDDALVKAGNEALDYLLRDLWAPKLRLVRHVASEDLCLFEDQVSFLGVLLNAISLARDDAIVELAEELVKGVGKSFTSPEGGYNDVIPGGNQIGELETPKRRLVDNSDWALGLARLGTITHNEGMIEVARSILGSFARSEIEAHGVFAAAYLRARLALDGGMALVEIHGNGSDDKRVKLLRASSTRLFEPSIVSVTVKDDDQTAPFAVVCVSGGCSNKIEDPDELLNYLRQMLRSG